MQVPQRGRISSPRRIATYHENDECITKKNENSNGEGPLGTFSVRIFIFLCDTFVIFNKCDQVWPCSRLDRTCETTLDHHPNQSSSDSIALGTSGWQQCWRRDFLFGENDECITQKNENSNEEGPKRTFSVRIFIFFCDTFVIFHSHYRKMTNVSQKK